MIPSSPTYYASTSLFYSKQYSNKKSDFYNIEKHNMHNCKKVLKEVISYIKGHYSSNFYCLDSIKYPTKIVF